MTQARNLALVTDIISYGASRFAHTYKHQFVRGDGSVDLFRDRNSPLLSEEFGWQPHLNNDVLFLALDHPLDYRTYLK